jgi:peptidyl-dipeptidase A
MNKDYDEYNKIWQNKELYYEFLNLKNTKLNKHEKKQLKEILKSFEEELLTGEDLKTLNNKENEISKKYNSYVPKIDGREVSKAEISKILEKEKDPEIRKKAYEANIIGGDLIAEDLKEFAILRNNYAVKKGYPNYFEYKLKETFEVDLKELEILLDDVYNKSKDLIKNEIEKEKEDLSKVFNIKKEDLKAYHYGLLTENNPEKKVNDYIKNKEQIVDLAKKAYQGMGYDIDKLENEGKLILDLYPRKNKNTHAFSFDIDAGKDARVLANLTNNVYSLKVLLHELGHSVYTLDISEKFTSAIPP